MIEQTEGGTYEVLQDARRTLQEEGKLLAKVYNEPAIFELEAKKIFTKTWIFLAHESEIPWPGDYVLRRVISDSFIVTRDEDGQIHVLFNMCKHRGMQLCRSDAGNASHFRCPYHGYTFSNTGKLQGVPFEKEAYGPEGLDKDEYSMTAAPKMEIYKGLIFASLNPDVPPLEEYIGDMGWYLDFYLEKSPAGLEVIGAPQRWVMPADWKLAAENFIGDGYHTQSTHMSTIKAGIMRVKSPAYLKEGVQITASKHGCLFMGFPPGNYFNYPQSIVDSMLENLNEEQVEVLKENSIMPLNATVFPNLSFLHSSMAIEAEGQSIPYFTLRVWQPIGAGKMEIWSWCLVEQDADEKFKKNSNRAYLTTFGASGTLEQDDAENWSGQTRVGAGEMAGQHYLNYSAGSAHVEPIPENEWPGPGTAYPKNYVDFAQRHFWQTYFDFLLDGYNGS
ncbi:MAG: aromatic ring-hydroxylating dioxygenase subunit alpha [Actinomycetota bacterium]|nr:aromatic ring-hydroxylating dioxygenase subunit alpha [Actinomycetota bacterium]